MSLLVPSFCRTCANQHVALQPRRIPRPILTHCSKRSLSITSCRSVSFGSRITPKVIEERRKKYANAKPLPLQVPFRARRKLKDYSLESELSLEDQFKAALTSDAPFDPVPKKKAPKLQVKGLGSTAPLTPEAFAKSFVGISLPEKKYKSKPTKTDNIGMLNRFVATTSTRKAPAFKSPIETPPLDYAKQDLYLSPSGSFTYDVDVMPFDWRNHTNYVSKEPKREPWVAKEEVPPPGVIIPRWWPQTQEGWDQLDSPQVHAAEEAYARFNPKQPTDSQQYHAERKTVLRAVKSQKREIQKQADLYEMQLKVAEGKKSRVPPSKESGGVPDPSQDYLVKLEEPSRREPQPLLVVVDLNGTMLHRPNPKRQPRTFVKRPFSSVFFNYCVKTFWVVVWSSARADNVGVMCDNLSSPDVMRNNVVAVWARDRFGLSPSDYDGRVQCYKRLTKLWEDPHVAKSHPHYAEGGRWSQANTVLIDDTPEKARAEPHNAVIVPEFTDDNSKYDGILPSVHDYLNELCFQSNVSNYMRENPFYIRSDFEAVAEKPASTEFYEEKQATKEKRKSRLSYTYEPSSLSLKHTVAKHKWDSIAKQRAGQ
ncbi:phosphoprotein phosphatase [Ophiostoma piceae UAMH 11346]|uniref:Mitochondrial import inner membrane translocase subunit TIM50 n=1 Tax=Ophiostoma piceae (strain UAMH 11346) TaxID=1262450 RepID=S3CCE4_OPHP1|nr:phosphoprotein phosphatase [Ophiostoma piceae UAMH 11346]